MNESLQECNVVVRKQMVFSIYDEKGKFYAPPFVMQLRPMAVRAFGDLCNDPQSMIFRHKEDYKLYLIGEWDQDKGYIQSLSIPEYVCSGKDFMNKETI